MFEWLKGRALRRRTGQQLYERIVAQARDPALYVHYRVPDTMDGRLEMVLLHTVLVLDRLHSEGRSGQRPGQQLMEQLVADIDDALRQIGLGDDSVSPRIKRLGSALSERTRDYRTSLSGEAKGDIRLETRLLEHAYRLDSNAITPDTLAYASKLANYARRCKSTLRTAPSAELLSGSVAFPPVVEPSIAPLEKP